MLKHSEDILSLAAYETSVVATSSYDGDIFIWSLETAQPLCLLNANAGVSPRSGSRTVNYAYKADSAKSRPSDAARLTRRSSAASCSNSAAEGDSHGEGNQKQCSSATLLKRTSTNKTFLDEATSGGKEDQGNLRRTSLPAIGSSKASVADLNNTKQQEGATVDTNTFFTESLSNFKGRRAQSGRDGSSSRKSFYVDVEDSKEYTKKHESAVDKVSSGHQRTYME